MKKAAIKYKDKHFTFHHFGEGDHISKSLIRGEWYESRFLNYLYSNAPKGGTYVDVGAFIGTHSVFFAEYLAEKVVAFEPNPESYNLLLRNTAGLPVDCWSYAITVDGRRMNCSYSPENKGNTKMIGHPAADVTVSSNALPAIFKGHKITLIKIDVEGMQNEVFAAFLPLIEQHRPWIAIECSQRECNEYLGQLDSYVFVKRFGATHLYLIKPNQ